MIPIPAILPAIVETTAITALGAVALDTTGKVARSIIENNPMGTYTYKTRKVYTKNGKPRYVQVRTRTRYGNGGVGGIL